MKSVLVFDLGASNGRAMLCGYDGGRLSLREVHRFPNDPVTVRGILYWDILRLFHEIKQGIVKAYTFTDKIESIGIDSWGVDFGFIGSDGRLLGNPVCYRDRRTEGIIPRAEKKLSSRRLYEITGIQNMEINTVFQLYALSEKGQLPGIARLLMIPDLINYFLTGNMLAESSIASTTGLAANDEWSEEILSAFGLPREMFPDIVPPGTRVGELSEDICTELRVPACTVTAVCGHDTQCAAAAVPAKPGEDHIFISCGTWSLFGTVTDEPVKTELSASLGISNERGWGGRTTFLKNIIGLWFMQETRRYLAKRGEEYSFADLEKMAENAEGFKCFIDPDSPEFVPPGDIPGRVQEYCKRTGQYVPGTLGEIMRCIYESLAMKYRQTKDEIESCTGKKYDRIYMVGGGIKDKLLCRMAACACGCTVTVGPAEAAAYGNGMVQLVSLGVIESMEKAAEILSASECTEDHGAEDTGEWERAYERYKALLGG